MFSIVVLPCCPCSLSVILFFHYLHHVDLTEVLAIINTVLEQRARDGPFNGNGVFADTLVASKAPREEVISDIITYILQAVTNINYGKSREDQS